MQQTRPDYNTDRTDNTTLGVKPHIFNNIFLIIHLEEMHFYETWKASVDFKKFSKWVQMLQQCLTSKKCGTLEIQQKIREMRKRSKIGCPIVRLYNNQSSYAESYMAGDVVSPASPSSSIS